MPVWDTVNWMISITDIVLPNMNVFYTNKTVLSLESFNIILLLSFFLFPSTFFWMKVSAKAQFSQYHCACISNFTRVVQSITFNTLLPPSSTHPAKFCIMENLIKIAKSQWDTKPYRNIWKTVTSYFLFSLIVLNLKRNWNCFQILTCIFHG